MRTDRLILLLAMIATPGVLHAEGPASRQDALLALEKATAFFHGKVADHGGYVWSYSGDLKLREGEGITDDRAAVWVQPPGTPSVGEAFLEAYEATGSKRHLTAARHAAEALLRGQLESGGWEYHIQFSPEKRKQYAYRVDGAGSRAASRPETGPGGWDLWKQRKYKGNMTLLDDDTTQAALRFLIRLDRVLGFKDEPVHEAALYGLESLLRAQYPNGSWSHYHDRFPAANADEAHYPVIKARYPESWSRTWTKDWNGCYRLNDRITLDCITTLLDSFDAYREDRFRASALRGGEFLLLAQMPEPQPAWAQQYDREMHPVWDRKFEPPAISGFESQDVLKTLLLLYHRTGDRKYLEPFPSALAYLQASRLPNGKLARFYELRTNKPLYFTKDYQLTYDPAASPTHYGFQFESRLEEIDAEYRRLIQSGPNAPEPRPSQRTLSEQAGAVIAAMDSRGAWVERGSLDQHNTTPASGVIRSQTFAANVGMLSRFIATGK